MEFRRSSLVTDRTAATEKLQKDLPVNPLSHLVITLAGYNATDETTLAEILAFINSVTVSRDGKTIFYAEGEDVYGVHSYIVRRNPVLTQKIATDNSHRALTLYIPFGRKLFDPDECLPPTKKGELQLTLDYTAPATSMDNGILNIETIELIGANPSNYMKTKMKTISAPGAVGDNEVDLPIGNKIIALQLRMTTFPATSSHTYGVENLSVLRNNRETGFKFAKGVTMHGDVTQRIQTQGANIAALGSTIPDNIVWADYDPNRDGNFLLETAGASRVHAVLNMGVDEATYLTTLELVESMS